MFLIETKKSKNNVRDIVVEGDNLSWYLSEIENENHKVKYVPRDYRIPTDIILSDGNVFQTSYEDGQEMVVQIRHDAYYKTMVTVFDLIWNFLPEEFNLI